VIDPTKVVRTALQNAASVASLLITTSQLLNVVPGTPLEGPLDGAARWELRR